MTSTCVQRRRRRRELLLACATLALIGVCHSLSFVPVRKQRPLSSAVLLKVASSSSFSFQSQSQSQSQMPRGSAKNPLDKQKVAIFGGGGYLGGCTFGFLQRCSSLYGTGIGSVRNICATAVSSECLNRILSKSFLLAYAGEDMQRLTNMTSVGAIRQRLQGYSAVIMGTSYYLEQRPVTLNTYETSPNSKTTEFYLDVPRRGTMDEDIMVVDPDYQSFLFENTLQACRATDSTVKHVIVIETPSTSPERAQQCARLLDESSNTLSFTYIKVCGSGPLETTKDYTFVKGLQSDLHIDSFTFAPEYATTRDGYVLGSWMKDLEDGAASDDALDSDGEQVAMPVPREDVAALIVQCLQSLDWSTSRCLLVSSNGGKLEETETQPLFKRRRVDKEWCVGSELLADKLAIVQ